MSSGPVTRTYPDEAEIDHIERLPDPIVRNLRVTWGYHELANAIAARTGPWINWCAMATWASRQAGRTIRSEDFDAAVERILQELFETGVAERLIGALRAIGARSDVAVIRSAIARRSGIADALRRSADAVSRGNVKVFTEIGRDMSRFLRLIESGHPLDEAAIGRFCESMPPGDPPDGKGLLRNAVVHLHRAMVEEDPAQAAQWQLLSNLEIGFHEQVRLQNEIAAAIDSPLPDARELVDRLMADLFPFGGWFVRARHRLRLLLGGPTPLDHAAGLVLAEARFLLRRFITRRMMTLELPGVVLRLGADVPTAFPASVAQLANPELIALLTRIDPTPSGPHESAAIDWADFDERMHFICDLFRAWHESPELLGPPFTDAQVAELRAGRVPAGRL